MAQKYMMTATDVAAELEISRSTAYKIVKEMNDELAKQGYITIAGKVPRAFFAKKCTDSRHKERGNQYGIQRKRHKQMVRTVVFRRRERAEKAS